MKDRIEKGKKVTVEAIREADAARLSECISKFVEIGASPEDLTEAIGECPIALFEETGRLLTVHSGILGRDITIGKDVTWDAVRELLAAKTAKEELCLIFEAREMFGGVVVSEAAEEDGVQSGLFPD